VLLHAGASGPELHEPPLAERSPYRVRPRRWSSEFGDSSLFLP
jgi:hypothetical protein